MIPGSCDTITVEIAYTGAAGSHLLILKSILPRANFEGFSGSNRSWEVSRAPSDNRIRADSAIRLSTQGGSRTGRSEYR